MQRVLARPFTLFISTWQLSHFQLKRAVQLPLFKNESAREPRPGLTLIVMAGPGSTLDELSVYKTQVGGNTLHPVPRGPCFPLLRKPVDQCKP